MAEDFGEALEALEASQSTSEAPVAPDSGASPSPDPSPSSPDPAPSVPGEAPASPTTPPAAPPASAPAASAKPAASSPQMVRYEALKEAREANRSLKETYGWLPPDDAPKVRAYIESLRADPVTRLVEDLQGLLGHPQYGPQLQALMGQDSDPEPPPDYQAADGTPVRSAGNQAEWIAWRERKLEQKIEQRYSEKFRPLETFVQSADHRAKLAEITTKADSTARAILAPYEKDPHFQEHRADIRARFQEYVGEMPGEVALHRAYAEIIREKVLPGLSTQSARAVVQQLNRKPGATGPNPGRPAAAATPRGKYKDFDEALQAGVIG